MNFFERAAQTLRGGIGVAGPTVAVPAGQALSPSATGDSTSTGTSQSPSMSSIGAHMSDGDAHDGDTDDDVTDTEDDSGIVDHHHHHRQHSQRKHRLELAERAKRFFPDLGIDESMAGQQGTTLNSFLTYW